MTPTVLLPMPMSNAPSCQEDDDSEEVTTRTKHPIERFKPLNVLVP
jgi:hypothetical protein